MKRTLISELVAINQAKDNCFKSGKDEWHSKHSATLARLFTLLPSGSGIDCGTKVEMLSSTKCVFSFSFHHMDEMGGYDGWTEHKLIVVPTFSGLDMHITGRDKNQIKEYLYDVYYHALNQEIDPQ